MTPYISVVIPVKNGGANFELCLQGLRSSDYKDYELIVVNDGSTDNTPEIAEKYGAKVLHSTDYNFEHKEELPIKTGMGPAGARNIGVIHAEGEIIYFIDGDVVPHKNNLQRVANLFRDRKEVSAIFGSYDDSPGCENFISQYRNLLHTYIHQISREDAETFWTGCGAIRKDVFLKLGGFDLETYPLPSIEDVDLGYRMKGAGYKIYLDKQLRVKHLKTWTFKNMLKTDVFHRAIPWARLMCKRKRMPDDLNIRTHHRVSGAIVVIIFTTLIFITLNLLVSTIHQYNLRVDQRLHYFYYDLGIPMSIATLSLILLLAVSVIILNRNFYAFLYKAKGFFFTLKAIPLHFFYYFYSSATFAIFWVDYYVPPFRWLRKRMGLIAYE